MLPDPTIKQKLWDEIVSGSFEIQEVELKMQGFWQRQHVDLLVPYFDKYYNILESIVETKDSAFAELFMTTLSPAFMARHED